MANLQVDLIHLLDEFDYPPVTLDDVYKDVLEQTGTRSRITDTYVLSKGTELGLLVENYQKLEPEQQKRLLGYMDALRK